MLHLLKDWTMIASATLCRLCVKGVMHGTGDHVEAKDPPCCKYWSRVEWHEEQGTTMCL